MGSIFQSTDVCRISNVIPVSDFIILRVKSTSKKETNKSARILRQLASSHISKRSVRWMIQIRNSISPSFPRKIAWLNCRILKQTLILFLLIQDKPSYSFIFSGHTNRIKLESYKISKYLALISDTSKVYIETLS